MTSALVPSYDPDDDAMGDSVTELVAIGINAALIRARSRSDAFRRWARSSEHTRAERRAGAASGLRFAGLNYGSAA